MKRPPVVVAAAVAASVLLAGPVGNLSRAEPPKRAGRADGDRPLGVAIHSLSEIERFARDRRLGRVEDFLRSLDPMMLSYYALMESSRSLQTPTDAERPRLILFRPDGRFFVGISTHPDSPSYDEVEILEFGDDANWRAGALSFDRRRFPEPTIHHGSPRSDRECMDCHGPDCRPIWGNYSGWAGAFDAANLLSDDQAAALTRNLDPAHPERNPRLKMLHLAKYTWAANELFLLPDHPRAPTNETFNEALGGPVTEHLWRKFAAVERADLYLVAHAFREVGGLTLDADLRARLDARIDRDWRARGYDRVFHRADRSDHPLLLLGLDSSRDLDLSEPYDGRGDARENQSGLSDKWFYIAIKIGNLLAFRYLNDVADGDPALRGHLAALQLPCTANCNPLVPNRYPHLDDYRVQSATFLWRLSLEKIARTRRDPPPTIDLRFGCLFTPELQARARTELQGLVRAILKKYP